MARPKIEDELAQINTRYVGAGSPDEHNARMVALAHARDAEEGAMFLAMLGLPVTSAAKAAAEGPPDYRCQGECGKQMYRKHWPPHHREGRVMCITDAPKCMTCTRNERIASGEILPRIRNDKNVKRKYKRRTVRQGDEP